MRISWDSQNDVTIWNGFNVLTLCTLQACTLPENEMLPKWFFGKVERLKNVFETVFKVSNFSAPLTEKFNQK